MSAGLHLDLDSAWAAADVPVPTRDLREWGPRLRYVAPVRVVEKFFEHIEPALADFILYGSGDFHYLSALWLRRVRRPVTVVCFDNHPDWDRRPPRWGCGGWVNRALELPNVRRVSVWGCGNFELAWPARIFANTRALQSGRLEVHAWAERQNAVTQRRFDCMTRENWRERFSRFARSLAGQHAYVTIDLDCLRAESAATNWESGLFTTDDLVWALGELRRAAPLAGGDLCGAFSPPVYDRWTQRFAGNWDHPKLPATDQAAAQRTNRAALAQLWPALTG
ncbi:MAG: hypothetical protein HY301_02625 [Verrucomicrobia bacterium]|nr:hypothetical protein [Verrucomicrobiota bacterium]